MTLYRGRYRVESARMTGWDYAAARAYFITICTRDRACVLGAVEISQGEATFHEQETPHRGVSTWPPRGVALSAVGQIVAEEWRRTAQVRDDVALDAWVIMPNHLHGIIHILDPVEMSRRDVSPHRKASPRLDDPTPATPRLQAGSLGAIIGQFKSACTRRARAAGHDGFAWQTRYYDRIVCDLAELDRIRHYIARNPARWKRDRDNSEGILI